MPSSSQTSVSSSQFESIISAALNEFKEKTGKTLLDDWLAKELQSCDSVDAVMDIIQGQAKAFDKFKNGGSKLMKWIHSSVHVLYTISAALGDGVGMAVPSAKAVFTGIGVLLAAAKDVRASHDALVELFERIQFFLKRLGVHTRISPTDDMIEILVKIMAEVISILSIATKEMQQSRMKIYIKKLVGRADIEDALKRLDGLTQEEVRMAIAQVLQGIELLKGDVKKANEDVREIKDDIKRDQIRRWFSPPDPSVNYNIAREAYQEGTAAWFFQSRMFKEWELVGSLLWIHGKPGSGKSILSSAIIKHVLSLRDAGHASLAYFFFDFRDKEKKQDPRNFLTSLLIQLFAQSNSCRTIISRVYSAHGEGTQQPSFDVLTNCLHEILIVSAQQPTYIIIDALDECPNISGRPTPRAVLLKLLKCLVGLRVPNLHICVSSRPEIDIKVVLGSLASGVVSLHDESGQREDIFHYINTAVYSDDMMARWRDDDKKLVVTVLSKKADGMFRWVYCQLEVLQHCFAASIRHTLDQLPETLDETYARVLGQIPQVNQAHAHRMLQCLMVAVRPLRVEELAELLAFEFGTAQGVVPKYRTDWRPNDHVQAVLSTCSSLVAIVDDNESRVVQFSHFSVKEFLISDRLTSSLGDFSGYQIIPGPAHTILAQACLGFLLHLNDQVDNEIVEFPLAKYAAEHWVTHAQFENVASRVKDGMVSLFDCHKPHFEAWVGIYNIDQPSQTYGALKKSSKIPTPLYYSSLCGFSDLVEHLAIGHPQDVNAIGGRYEFPLRAALVRKHVQVAEALLKHGANIDVRGMRKQTPLHKEITDVNIVQFLINHGADVNSRDNEGKTPFYLLLEDNCTEECVLGIARLLLEHGADVNIRTTDEWTLLHTAAVKGRLKIVRVLLAHGADVNAENERGETSLCVVSRGGYRSSEHGADIARLLLEHGVDVNAQKKNEGTPLHSAAVRGRLKIAKVLLDHGANVNAENERGETPLHVVSLGKYRSQEDGVGIVRLLLERGVDVHAQDKDHDTALHSAALRERLETTRVLLDHGADVNAEIRQGETPLHLVIRRKLDVPQEGGVGIARLLLERGADVNAQLKSKWTPLHFSAFKGRPDIMRVLLDYGANVNAENEQGEMPLHVVSRGEYYDFQDGVAVARMLLERTMDVDHPDKYHNTPLHFASYFGRLEIAQVLLDHGANGDAENDQDETPLHLVSRGKYDTQNHGAVVARLLLKNGVDANVRQKNKWTPLHSAAFRGRLEITKVLLHHGANADAKNDHGETPLDLVSRGEYDRQEHGVGIAQLLLENGVAVDTQNKDGWTPLHSAACRGRLEIAQMLLNHGANGDAETNQGETPLHLVSRGDYNSQEHGAGIARLLLEHGAEVNAWQKNKWTPLHFAAFRGRHDIARTLLDHGGNVNPENGQGETLLHAVSRGKYDSQEHGVSVAWMLLERAMEVNAPDKDQNTPLHFASYFGRLEIAQILLDHGANPAAENNQGATPLHLVSRGEYDSQDLERGAVIARLLLERGVDVNRQKRNEWTPLHLAAFKGRFEIARVLLDHGANPNAENEQGKTPLHVVSQGKHDSQEDGVASGIARLLLERGADVNAPDKDQYTPFDSASYFGKFDIARLLLEHGATGAEPASRETKRKADDVGLGSRSEKKL